MRPKRLARASLAVMTDMEPPELYLISYKYGVTTAPVKTYGNIVCLRDLQKQTDEAIALFGNKDAGGFVSHPCGTLAS